MKLRLYPIRGSQGTRADTMTLLHHPAFQSLFLPLLLGLGLALGLRSAGARWAALAPAVALLLALAAWPGFDWPAASRVQVLPWLALGGTAAALLALTLRVPGTHPWAGRQGLWAALLMLAAGGGLAAWGAFGGSLLLAQLGAMLASVSMAAAWQAWRYRVGSWAGWLPLALFAAGLAVCLALLPAPSPGGPEGDDPYYTPSWK